MERENMNMSKGAVDLEQVLIDPKLEPELKKRLAEDDPEAVRKMTQRISSKKYRINQKIKSNEMEVEKNELLEKNKILEDRVKELERKVDEQEHKVSKMIKLIQEVSELMNKHFPSMVNFFLAQKQ